jgi:hypothetical protein
MGGEAKVEFMVALDWDACCGSFDCRCRWQIICYLIEILDTGTGDAREGWCWRKSQRRSKEGDTYLFLPLVWPHGPIGRLGGLRRS